MSTYTAEQEEAAMLRIEKAEERQLKRNKRTCQKCRHWRKDETLEELAKWELDPSYGWHLCGKMGIPMGPYCKCDRWEAK